jgi:hypothetical protein
MRHTPLIVCLEHHRFLKTDLHRANTTGRTPGQVASRRRRSFECSRVGGCRGTGRECDRRRPPIQTQLTAVHASVVISRPGTYAGLETVRVSYFRASVGAHSWWAESPHVSGWLAAGSRYAAVRRLVEQGVPGAVGRADISIMHNPSSAAHVGIAGEGGS